MTDAQWAVWDDAGSYPGSNPTYETTEVLKVTAKTVIVRAIYGRGQNTRRADDILFQGDESTCRKLVERLNSSVGLMKDEVRRSKQRHADRVVNLISKAKGGSHD